MERILTRAIAGGSLAFALGAGAWIAGGLSRETKARVEAVMAEQVDPETAQREALARDASYERSEAFYETRIEVALERYEDGEEVEAPSLAALREANTFYHPITLGAPKTLNPGESTREGPLSIAVVIEELIADQRGIRSKTQHTLVKVENRGEVATAYRLLLREAGDGGECRIRALSRYDAMVLEPGESAEISICAGEHAVELTELRMLEVTTVGAIWVDKIPAQAVGLPDTAIRAHDPGRAIVQCTELPAAEIAGQIERGDLAWEDLIDFYSRHDCEQYEWPPGYERAVEPLAELPLLAKPGADEP